jgi:hypothetical protein
MAMLKAIFIGLLGAAFLAGIAFVFYTAICSIIDCMPDPNDEED